MKRKLTPAEERAVPRVGTPSQAITRGPAKGRATPQAKGGAVMKDQFIPPQLLLTAKQAAAALSISERTLWELTRRGEIPRLKIGASVRYDLRDCIAFIDKKKGGAV